MFGFGYGSAAAKNLIASFPHENLPYYLVSVRFFARDCFAMRALNWRIFFCRFASDVARIFAAKRPALRPLPMATVATGTPAGICTIDSRESRPFNALDSIGTP